MDQFARHDHILRDPHTSHAGSLQLNYLQEARPCPPQGPRERAPSQSWALRAVEIKDLGSPALRLQGRQGHTALHVTGPSLSNLCPPARHSHRAPPHRLQERRGRRSPKTRHLVWKWMPSGQAKRAHLSHDRRSPMAPRSQSPTPICRSSQSSTCKAQAAQAKPMHSLIAKYFLL